MPYPKKPAQPQPTFNLTFEGDTYRTTDRITRKSSDVYVAEVKRDVVKLKRSKDCVDSFTISRAKFDKFYVRVETAETKCHDFLLEKIRGFHELNYDHRSRIVECRLSHTAQFDEFLKSGDYRESADIAKTFIEQL